MHVEQYELNQLKFAYCCHVYYRWHTHCRKPHPALTRLTPACIQAERPDMHVLTIKSSPTDLALLASLRPGHSVSIGASKVKGAVSKLTRKLEDDDGQDKVVGDGYFASTVGPRTFTELDRYLENQLKHHGYDRWANPPVFVRSWPDVPDLPELSGRRTVTSVRWHLVFSTWDRQGAFTRKAAERVVEQWQSELTGKRARFIKISFLADHVHLALRTHPAEVPAALVVDLLNSSQDLMRDEFAHLMISAGTPRLWKPGAYIGTVGDLSSGQLQAYLKGWLNRSA